MKNVLMAVCLSLAALGCDVSSDTAQEVLTDEGYHDIRLTGHAWFGCGDDDSFATNFVANRWIVQEDGTRIERSVEGTICCGYWKNCTIRH